MRQLLGEIPWDTVGPAIGAVGVVLGFLRRWVQKPVHDLAEKNAEDHAAVCERLDKVDGSIEALAEKVEKNGTATAELAGKVSVLQSLIKPR